MFKNTCQLAKYLEKLTAVTLDLERKSKIWKVRETSITDTIIANFFSFNVTSGVKVDASDELTTNADFEVIFRKAGKDLTVLIQAKRTKRSLTGTTNIPELFHPHASGDQCNELINYANTNRMFSLYAVYLNSASIKELSNCMSSTFSGIMLENASTIRNEGFKNPKNNILLARKLLKNPKHFHELFCIAEKERSLNGIKNWLSDAFGEQDFNVITDEISLDERSRRDSTRWDNRAENYDTDESENDGSHTPRLLVEL
jgi:hypothetical protein